MTSRPIPITLDQVLDVMLLMVRAQAQHNNAGYHKETQWMEWCGIRLAFYPVSGKWRWFGKDGPITKADAVAIIRKAKVVTEHDAVPA